MSRFSSLGVTLPGGWHVEGDTLVVPDGTETHMTMGAVAALNYAREVRTESGKVIKSRSAQLYQADQGGLEACPCCGASAHWNPKETTLPGTPVTYNLELGFVECVKSCVRTSGIAAKQIAFKTWNTRAPDTQLATLQQRNAGLEAALVEVDGCFEAALFEGWTEALALGDIERIRNLWERRISYARHPIHTLTNTDGEVGADNTTLGAQHAAQAMRERNDK